MITFTLLPWSVQAALIALVLAAAAYDVRYRRIPNWLNMTGILAGIGLNAVVGAHVGGFAFALKGLALGFGFYLALYALRAMGAGDVKLMGAVGAMVGWQNWLGIMLLTAIMGGVAAVALAARRKRLGSTFWNMCFILGEAKKLRPAYLGRQELDVKNSKSLGLPHGAVIAVASIFFLVIGPIVTR